MEKVFNGTTNGLRDKRRHCVADEPELMRASDWKGEPVRKALHTRGFARSERAMLPRVDEHQPVLAEMSNDGGARLPSALPGVAVFEAGLVVGKIEHNTPAHGLSGVLSLAQLSEIAEIAFAVWTGAMRGEVLRSGDFKDAVEIVPRSDASLPEMLLAELSVVVANLLATTCRDWRKIADGIAEGGVWTRALSGPEIRWKITGHIISHSNDELPAALLRDAQFPSILNLRMNAVAAQTARMAERPSLMLNLREILATSRSANAKDIFHHEHARLKEIHVSKKFAEELSAGIVLESCAVVRTIDLTCGAEPLAWRPANDHVHALRADERGELLRIKFREVGFERVAHARKIRPESRDGLRVQINRSEATESSPLHAEAEAAAAAKEVEKCQGGIHTTI